MAVNRPHNMTLCEQLVKRRGCKSFRSHSDHPGLVVKHLAGDGDSLQSQARPDCEGAVQWLETSRKPQQHAAVIVQVLDIG